MCTFTDLLALYKSLANNCENFLPKIDKICLKKHKIIKNWLFNYDLTQNFIKL